MHVTGTIGRPVLQLYYSIAAEHYLVYWSDEESVSVVPVDDVRERCAIGENCEVKFGRKTFRGKVSTVGKSYTRLTRLHVSIT